MLIQDNYFSGPAYHGCVNMAIIQMVSCNKFQVTGGGEEVSQMSSHTKYVITRNEKNIGKVQLKPHKYTLSRCV